MLRRKKCIAICSIALSSLVTAPAFAQKTTVDRTPVLRMERNERDKMPSSITFTPDAGFKASDAQSVFSKFLELNRATDELRFRKSIKAAGGIVVDRYEQFFKGIPVEHGDYIVASKNGVMSYISGEFYKTNPALGSTPQLTEAAALEKATQHVGAKKYMWDDADGIRALQLETGTTSTTGIPEGKLVYIEDYFSGEEPDGHLHLAYRFDIYAAQPLSRNYVYVDAATGQILFADALMKHAHGEGPSLYSGPVSFITRQTGSTYSLHDDTRGGGIHTYTLNGGTNVNNRQEKTSNDTVWTTDVALDAHWGATKVYDYWKEKHNRLSYDGNNAPLNSYVDFDVNYNNANWSGSSMRYGNGTGRGSGGFDPLVALDICGHEIGHGVCAETAGLIYSRESGGMNEGFSDIWGAAIEHYADPHETDATAKRYFDIGEEISNQPLRSMSQPKLHGDPDTYKGVNWKYATSNCQPGNTNDQCGVHSNSGVLNKWFYLLTMGGRGTNDVGGGYEVLGLGFDTAAIIAYGTEVALANNATYAAARTASLNFANTLFGPCSKEVEMLTRAWYAVNVGDNYVACSSRVSFPVPEFFVSENANANSCTASRVITIPVQLNGPAPTGGNAVVTVSVAGGTAVSGVDYTLNTTTLTFPAGSTAAQNIELTILDNGNIIDSTRYVDLDLTFAANGSNATLGSVLTRGRVIIQNNDLGPVQASVNATSTLGATALTATTTSPFRANANMAHTQYIVTATELAAIGLRRGSDISRLGFTVTNKRSAIAYTDYTVRLGHTTLSEYDATNGMVTTGLTQVFADSFRTALGLNTIIFSNNFTWNGTSNLVIDICFTNTTRAANVDEVNASFCGFSRATFNTSNALTGTGCALGYTAANLSDVRPVMRFTQSAPGTPIESTLSSTRTWNIRAGERVFFYSAADSELIGGLAIPSAPLNCVTASISREGVEFEPSVFAWGVNRSRKEMTITAENADTVSNQIFFYMTTAEIGSFNNSAFQLIKTTAATDADINAGNMQVVAFPQVNATPTYTQFRATFNGVGRYFLVDGTPKLAVKNLNGTDGMWVNNNPFKNDISVSYQLQRNATAEIRLYDITGKVVYSAHRELIGGKQQFTIPSGSLNLAPGHYVLNVATASGVFTSKLLKQ